MFSGSPASKESRTNDGASCAPFPKSPAGTGSRGPSSFSLISFLPTRLTCSTGTVNQKVEVMVDEILAQSKEPPIIIFQADHGPASTFEEPDGGGWESPTTEMLRERMQILNAYYLPSGGDRLLYDSITPVNTFRVIFNSYFNATFELVDDGIYFSTHTRPYEFINVTDRVRVQ